MLCAAGATNNRICQVTIYINHAKLPKTYICAENRKKLEVNIKLKLLYLELWY